jgi:hypothetical protein
MSPTLAEEVSRELGIASEDLIEKGMIAYLERELRLAEEDIADLRERYGAISAKELERLIGSGSLPSHPAWEDLIVWENLENYVHKIKHLLERTRAQVA